MFFKNLQFSATLLIILLVNAYCNYYSNEFCTSTNPYNSTNVIVVVTNFHENWVSGTLDCENFQEAALSEILQIQRYVQTLDIKIDLVVCDVCSSNSLVKYIASERFKYIVETLNQTIIGIMTSLYTNQFNELIKITRIHKIKCPISTYSSTASNLTILNQNVIQMVPNDILQASAILGLLKSKSCNHVSLLYTRDIYSEGLVSEVEKIIYTSANNFDPICINLKLEANYRPTDNSTVQIRNIKDDLAKIFNMYNSQETVLIMFFGYKNYYSLLVKTLNNLIKDRTYTQKIAIISSEATINNLENLQIDYINSKIQLYAVSFKTLKIETIPELTGYYSSLLYSMKNDPRTISRVAEQLPWLIEYLMINGNCTFNNNSTKILANQSKMFQKLCDLNEISQYSPNKFKSITSQYILYLIYLLESFKTCLNRFQNGSIINIERLTRDLRNMNEIVVTINYNPYRIRTINGSLKVSNNEIYHLNQLIQPIQLNYLGMFSDNFWSTQNFDLEKCYCMHVCTSCLSRPEFVINECDGECDVYIVVIASLNQNENFTQCSNVRLSQDYIWWQSVLNTLDVFKNNSGKSTDYDEIMKLKIGTILINDCYIAEMVFAKLDRLKIFYPKHFNKTIGFLGPTASSASLSFIKFARNTNVFSISSVATSPSLSNKINFARTVPDDTKQTDVMVKLILKLGWNCVVGLYSDNEYGKNGDLELQKSTKSYNITYNSLVLTSSNLPDVVQFINNSKSQVIIFFADLGVIQNYFNYLFERRLKMKFIYITGDSWRVDYMLQNVEYYLGSFVIQIGTSSPTPENQQFVQFIREKYFKLINSSEAYVTDEYFNALLGCNRQKSFTNTLSTYKTCSSIYSDEYLKNKIETIITSSLATDAVRYNFLNSLYALLAAYNKFISDICMNNKTTRVLCLINGFKDGRIKDYVLNITLKKDSKGRTDQKIFNVTNGNGNDLTYSIYHIKGVISNINFTRVFTYENENLTATNSKVNCYSYYGFEIDCQSVNYCKIQIPLNNTCDDEFRKQQTILVSCVSGFGIIIIFSLFGSLYLGSKYRKLNLKLRQALIRQLRYRQHIFSNSTRSSTRASSIGVIEDFGDILSRNDTISTD